MQNLNDEEQAEFRKLSSNGFILKPIKVYASLLPENKDERDIWSFLCLNGSLSASKSTDTLYKVIIPNKEMKQFYKQQVDAWSKIQEKKSEITTSPCYRNSSFIR
jgi:hypothetical protein